MRKNVISRFIINEKKKIKGNILECFPIKTFQNHDFFFFLLAIIAQHFNHNNNNHKIFVTSQALCLKEIKLNHFLTHTIVNK